MAYKITQYTYDRAKKLGVTVKPSVHPNKKIDVYDKNNKFLVAVGDPSYRDYPTYVELYGETYAKWRRSLYRLRHHKDIHIRGSPGWYASKLLW